MRRKNAKTPEPLVPASFIYTQLLGMLSLAFVALLWRENVLLATMLLIIGASMLYFRKNNAEIALFAFCALAGTAAEAVGIHFGAWSYANATAFGVPSWLALLWGIASVYMLRCYRQLEKMAK